MLKSIFRKNEIVRNDVRVALQLTPVATEAALDDEFASLNENSEPAYTGPSVEEIKAEIENLRTGWQAEKAKLLEEAKAEAEKIIADAKEAAFNEVKVQTDIAQTIKTDAETKAEETVKQAEAKAVTIITEAEAQKSALENVAKEKGFAKGEEEGFTEGKAEAERLIERIHTVLERINAKRQEILDESESQIVTLVLLIARKVVKIISDNQKEVVLANVHEALQKVRQGGDIIIRVNMDDVKLATEHSKEFITSIENASGTVPGISIIEDSSIGRGGCVIETDFGAVDARIANQLAILEQKILEFSPVRMKSQVRAQATPQKNTAAEKVPIVMTDEVSGTQAPAPKVSGTQASGTQTSGLQTPGTPKTTAGTQTSGT